MPALSSHHHLLKPVAGFSPVECGNPDHVWAIERRAELSVPEVPAGVESIVFSFTLLSLNARTVQISGPDDRELTIDLIPGRPERIKLPVLPTSANCVIGFDTDTAGVKPGGDKRTLFFDVGNANVRFLQKTKFKTIDELKTRIDLEITNDPVLGQIRAFNHTIIGELGKVRSLSNSSILDVGGSVHGYALEAALNARNVQYEGINLGVAEAWDSPFVEFAGHGGSVGRLRQMDAEALDFPDETFDGLVSGSTFEHFLRPDAVLAEMHRVLRGGGVAYISFDGVWSCSYGYHLLQFGKLNDRVAPWSHLFLSKEKMKEVMEREPWPVDAPISLQEAIQWIYEDTDLNRLGIRELRRVFEQSAFEVLQLTPLMDVRLDAYRPVAEYLSLVLPWTAEELLTRGMSVLLKKR